MLQEEDLGDWRRTHYSSEINPSVASEGTEVLVMGWVSSVRDHGNIQFIIVKDPHGEIQVTAKKGDCSDDLFQISKEVKEHSSVAVRGRLRPQEKAPNGAELVPTELKAFSIAKKASP
ncbi:MAG: OB-fold nucleic acid binding domain-containing protein, partial [Nitrososphaera sp.]